MSSTTVKHQVESLNAMIQQGRIMEAMREFYADDVIMAENDADTTVGLEANLVREQDFVDNTEWHGLVPFTSSSRAIA